MAGYRKFFFESVSLRLPVAALVMYTRPGLFAFTLAFVNRLSETSTVGHFCGPWRLVLVGLAVAPDLRH